MGEQGSICPGVGGLTPGSFKPLQVVSDPHWFSQKYIADPLWFYHKSSTVGEQGGW